VQFKSHRTLLVEGNSFLDCFIVILQHVAVEPGNAQFIYIPQVSLRAAAAAAAAAGMLLL